MIIQKYVQVRVFKDVPRSEEEYKMMMETIPDMIKKVYDANDYILTYLIDDEIVKGDVYVAPYGKQSRIVVVEREADESDIKPEINYRPLTLKIDNILER